MDDLGRFCCLHPDCPDHGKRGHRNLTVPARYGPHQTRALRRSTYMVWRSERKYTPLSDDRLPPGEAVSVLAHVAEGGGTRKAARRVGVHPGTVTRHIRLAGGHVEQLDDEFVAFPLGDG